MKIDVFQGKRPLSSMWQAFKVTLSSIGFAPGNLGRNLKHMSKANQKFVQADEAVSPVIGVILMVAITVVLAAVVFVLVSNLSKSGQKAPDAAFSTDETRDRMTIVTAQSELTYADFEFKSSNPDIKWLRNGAPGNSAGATFGSSDYLTMAAATAPFNAGDYFEFCSPTAQENDPTTFQVRHIDSNTVVYETVLNTIHQCL